VPETIEGILQYIVNFKFNHCNEMFDYAVNSPELFFKERKTSKTYIKEEIIRELTIMLDIF
jgi:hypothetical protein